MMPSALFFNTEEGRTCFGRQGIAEYLEGYTGRLMRSFKSILGSSLIDDATKIGTRSYNFRDIIGLFIGHIKHQAELAIQTDLKSVVMGRPVFFVDDNAAADQKAQNELETILINAGFKDISFEYEPIAAARNYEEELDHEELVLVFDIGGGTSDFTLMRLSPEGRARNDRSVDILANSGVHIGGTDFDRKFSLHTVMPHMGYETMLTNGMVMPKSEFHTLATWHLINTLYNAKSVNAIRDLYMSAKDQSLTRRLLKTVTEQLGHEVANQVEHAKIKLTEKTQHVIALDFVEEDWSIPLSGAQLDLSIARELDRIFIVASETVKQGGVGLEDIDTIFLTGGSTALPAFETRIAQMFPASKVAHGDKFSSVASGLGLTARSRYGAL